MRLIVASGNPGKLTFLEQFFTGTGHILESCGIGLDVEENGADPAENALIKAEACAERLGKPAVALDSGLYLTGIPMDDPRQPGLFVRRVNGRELSYEEMVGHYRALARSFGGRVRAAWCDGYAVSFGKGRSASFLMPEWARITQSFWLLDEQRGEISPGMPIDCISEFLPRTEEIVRTEAEYHKKLRRFFRETIAAYEVI